MAVSMNGLSGLDLIDAQLEIASTPPPARKAPLFFFFKDGRKAVIRPLANLQDMIVLKVHDKWSPDREARVNAVCAKEEGKECEYCLRSAKDRKLAAGKIIWYLPVYIHAAQDTYDKDGNKIAPTSVTWSHQNEDGNEVTEALSGVRIIEMSAFGATSKLLKYFMEFIREDDNPAVTELDFSLSQAGAGQKKDFVIMPKTVKPMAAHVQEAKDTLNLEELRARIIEFRTPLEASALPSARGTESRPVAVVTVTEIEDDTLGDF